MEGGDSINLNSLPIPEDYYKYYDVTPLRFRSEDYITGVICYDIFSKEGIYPDSLGVYRELGYDLPQYIDNIYGKEFEINNIICSGTVYMDKGKYIESKEFERELNGLIIKIPEFNYSKIEFEEKLDSASLRNKNLYWDVKFRIIPPESKIICKQVPVDEIEYKEERPNDTVIYYCQTPIFENGKEYCPFKISKQDLDIEWLGENAECTGGCEYECIQEYHIHKNINKLNSCFHERDCPKTPYPVCSEYKIGNFTIGVST